MLDLILVLDLDLDLVRCNKKFKTFLKVARISAKFFQETIELKTITND